MNTETKINHRLFGLLITPSWLSGLFVLTVSLIITGGVIGITHFSGSNIEAEYSSYQSAKTQHGLLETYRTDKLHAIISAAPLMVFWSLIGLVVYLLATNIVGAIQQASEIKSELDYVNADRSKLMRTAGLHFLVRIVVMAAWLPYILFFFHHILPYVITAATVGASLTLDSSLYIVLAVVAMASALHLHIILLRLLLLRPRVMSRALYVS
jgi:hypothetical protein